MFMSNRAFAEKLYSFLKDNEPSGRFSDLPPEDCINKLENYLSDLYMVRKTIKDIEEIADFFDDHEVYVTDAKPLLHCLRDIEGALEAEQRKRMVSDTNYEVKHAIHVGDKEILFAEDKNAENGMCWFVGDYTQNEIIGQYADCVVCDDYLEAMQEFTERALTQVKVMKAISQSKLPQIFTSEKCYRNDYSQSIDGKIVAIKADVLRPEYRHGDVQLVLVDGGNGSKANPIGRAVYCYHLNDGKHTRFERSDVQGEVRPEYLPAWAKEKAAAIQAEKAAPSQEKPQNREVR